MIKVLIVEDSSVASELLKFILTRDDAIRIVGSVSDGIAAVVEAQRLQPDLITMDIHLPRLDGFQATREIMQTAPTPILIVSGSSRRSEIDLTFKAIEAGALAFVPRPVGPGHPDFDKMAEHLTKMVKLMSEVKVVRRIQSTRKVDRIISEVELKIKPVATSIKAVFIGASTGGPAAIKTILSGLPANFPVPILIVQHMTKAFTAPFCEWLATASKYPVRLAEEGNTALPGIAYVAPDGYQMSVASDLTIRLREGGKNELTIPSVSHLFLSAANSLGASGIGILLTGMGRDGAADLRLMKEAGAETIAQDEKSSIVHGMPGEAIRLGAADMILNPEEISLFLQKRVSRT